MATSTQKWSQKTVNFEGSSVPMVMSWLEEGRSRALGDYTHTHTHTHTDTQRTGKEGKKTLLLSGAE